MMEIILYAVVGYFVFLLWEFILFTRNNQREEKIKEWLEEKNLTVHNGHLVQELQANVEEINGQYYVWDLQTDEFITQGFTEEELSKKIQDYVNRNYEHPTVVTMVSDDPNIAKKFGMDANPNQQQEST